MMNAGIRDGARRRSIADVIEKIRVMDYNGRVAVLSRRNIAFSYRSSGLEKYIILGVHLRLERSASAAVVKSRILAYARRRSQTQDYRYPCAGCIFKNPPDDSAGRLIELCGMKGACVGQAVVSKVHANFIVNTGNAKARDVLRLMQKVRREVKKRFNVLLDTEVKVWR
jgi:UDP-N-acetylmuramate dehydrogenase